MTVALYTDVHVPGPIVRQLRLRGVDVLTANEDGQGTTPDDLLLERASLLGRVMVTQDIGFKVMAEDWIRQGRDFGGLVFAPQDAALTGRYIQDLELIAKASDPSDNV